MDLMHILNLDLKGVEEEYVKIASVLRMIGLSDYESRSYTALIAQGRGTADEVAGLAGIPRTSAYKAMQALKDRGYVTMSEGRPAIFHPVPPREIREKFIQEVDETFDKLEAVRGILSEKGTPQLVFTILGRERVLSKIGEILDSATSRLFISTPSMPAIRTLHSQRFRDAIKRGVEITLVVEPFVKVPESTKVYRRSGLLATDVISDGNQALIASPDLSICGYSDNSFLAGHLEGFMLGALDRARGKTV